MTEQERWKPIPGYNGAYWVSDHGRVRSHLAPPPRRGDVWLIMDEPQKILSTRGRMGRYPSVNLGSGKQRETRPVHRLVIEVFIGPCPNGMIVCHADDDPTNNHLSNLRYATYADNAADASLNRPGPAYQQGKKSHTSKTIGCSVSLRQHQWALIQQWAEDSKTSPSHILRQIVREYTLERMSEDGRQDAQNRR